MKPADAGTVLAVASAFDARLTPRSDEDAEAKAYAWALALDSDMPVDWARRHVAKHYAEASTTIMPADVNAAWRRERKTMKDAERERQRKLEIEAAESKAVPMPDEIKRRIHELANKMSMES